MKSAFFAWALLVGAIAPIAPVSHAESAAREQQTTALGTVTSVRQEGAIIGTVWRRDNTPLPYPLVQLRDVASGRAVTRAQGDAAGRFTFEPVVPGSYLVELVDESGAIGAVGQMFSIARGETVGTFIRLGANVPWYAGFFSNAAVASIASAAALGLAAVGHGDPDSVPASARF